MKPATALPLDWCSKIVDADVRKAVDRMVRAAAALRMVSDGVNRVTGDRFFRTLVRQLTHTLGVDIAFVAETVGGGRGARTIAVCIDGTIRDNFVYPLAGTPCAVLWTEPSCVVAADVQRHFPDDPLLQQLDVESYLGVRLEGSGAGPLGWLGIMHRRPVECAELAETILEVFASRASAEIERRRSEQLVDQVARHRSPDRSTSHWAAITRFDDGRFLEVSDTFLRRFGYARQEVVGHTVHELGIWVTPHDRERLLAQLAAHGAVRDFTFDVRTRNGEVRLVRLAGDLLGNGEERFILAVADDVTPA